MTKRNPLPGEMVVLTILLLMVFQFSGCRQPTASEIQTAKNILQSQPNGGCFCNNNCVNIGCTDIPGQQLQYMGVWYDVGCYCLCSSTAASATCLWDDAKWIKRTKTNGIEIDPEM
jgi:hypothetical protein